MAHYQLNQLTDPNLILNWGNTIEYAYEENIPIGYQLTYTCDNSDVLTLKKDKYHWWDQLKSYFSSKVGNAPQRSIILFTGNLKGKARLQFYHQFRGKTINTLAVIQKKMN